MENKEQELEKALASFIEKKVREHCGIGGIDTGEAKELITLVREHYGWVSASDYLPEDDGKGYLTMWSDGLQEVMYRHDSQRGMWEGKIITNAVMTHWRPLPSQPTTEKDK